jgi:hypothetical protein
MQAKHQFYRKGVDNQKRADITIDLKRLDKSEMTKWTNKEKAEATLFINQVEGVLKAFIAEIRESIK